MWCRILLVDDEPQVIAALRRELLRKPDIGHDGLEIEAFTSPLLALKRAREDDAAFDVVIADYRIPEMDGIAFLSALQTIQPGMARILLTGGADSEGAIKAINDAQIDFLILKPWSEYDLKGRIALALHRRNTATLYRPTAAERPLRRDPYRLLLVDDDPAILKALEREISLSGAATSGRSPLFHISCHTDPAAALIAAAEECPDLVISDYAMPQIDGVTFFHRLRGMCPDAVRIMLSGRTDFGVLIDAINIAGVYHFLAKPWEPAELKSMLTQALVYRDILAASH